jgi:hypothetical protein
MSAINNRSKIGKFAKFWKLNNTLLSNKKLQNIYVAGAEKLLLLRSTDFLLGPTLIESRIKARHHSLSLGAVFFALSHSVL